MRPSHLRCPRDPERGSFLLAVIVLAVILGGLSLAFLQEGIAERTAIAHHESSLLALEVAEAGLIKAELEIQALTDPDADGIGTIADLYGSGSYEIQATQDPVQPDRWILQAEGWSGVTGRRIEVGLRRRENSYFVEGLFARDDMLLNGSIATDSYDSRKGDYASQAVNWDAGGPYAGAKGHVGSNQGILVLGTKAHVRGNAIPGPLRTVETSGDPVITGDQLARERPIPISDPPLAEFEAALQNNDNQQLIPLKTVYNQKTLQLRPKGQERVELSGGTYFFTDIDLSGGAQIVITGPCRIYVTGELDLTGGGVVNETGRPADCLIYAHPYPLPSGHNPANADVRLTGNAQAAMAVYAPERDVIVSGTSDIFGAVLGRTISVPGDARFHYDEALMEMKTDAIVYMERLYWREVNELPR